MFVVQGLSMQECTRGQTVYWQTTAAGKFDAIHATLLDGKLTIRLNVHKLWSKWTNGRLDNSGLLTMEDAVATLQTLLDTLDLKPEDVVSDKFAVGISMGMSRSPLDFVSQMISIGEQGKETYIDALYQKDRQRTTTKVKTVKKVLKVYDKTFEATDKGRDVPDNILRCETVYRRQGVRVSKLIDRQNLLRLQSAWWRDWSAAVFRREIRGAKGTKASQLDKATCIMTEGLDAYRARMRNAYMQRTITKKTWETIRTFCDAWDSYSPLFAAVPGPEEREYIDILRKSYETVIIR